MNAPSLTQTPRYQHFSDLNQSTISDACECDNDSNDSDCSCPQSAGTSNLPPGGEEDPRHYWWVFQLVTLPFILAAGIGYAVKWFKNRSNKGPGNGIPFSSGPLMIFLGFSSFFKRRDTGSMQAATPSAQASTPSQSLKPATQLLRDLLDDFNLHVGKNIPSYEGVEDRMRRYHTLPIFQLTPNARLYYVQFAIDEFIRNAIDSYDPAKTATSFWMLDIEDYISRFPLLLQDDRKQAEARAHRYVRVSQEALANIATQSADERMIRIQFRRRPGGNSYFGNYLGSEAFRMWTGTVTPRQREWFVSNTMRDMATKPKELPPLFETWFAKNAEPRLKQRLEKAWAALPEIFRNAMGSPANPSDQFPEVFYEMMLALEPQFEQNFARILERDVAPADLNELSQTDPVTVERRAIVAANPELAPYSNFVVLANARLAVAQNRSTTNGNGTGGTSGAGGAGGAGRGESGPSTPMGPEATGSSRIGLSGWFASPRIDSHESAVRVPWRDGSTLRRYPYTPEVQEDEDAGETSMRRRGVPAPTGRPVRQDRTPPPVRRADAMPKETSTGTVRGVFDPEETSTGNGWAPMDSSPVTAGASILFGRGRQSAHRPAIQAARPAAALRPAVLVRPAVPTVSAF